MHYLQKQISASQLSHHNHPMKRKITNAFKSLEHNSVFNLKDKRNKLSETSFPVFLNVDKGNIFSEICAWIQGKWYG